MNNEVSLISLGCARTLVDSEHMVQNMQSVGFTIVPEGTKESVTVLNTCSFIQSAIDETERNIDQLIERKKNNDIQYACVVGCYPSRFKESELKQKYPDHLKKVACLDSALSYILTNSQYDDTILFSPSASSFDLYDNFEHRGDVFKQTVKNL